MAAPSLPVPAFGLGIELFLTLNVAFPATFEV
jgi:hypothetical protein